MKPKELTMKNKKNTEKNAAVKNVGCPHCGSEKGEVCRAGSGKKVPAIHSARIDVYETKTKTIEQKTEIVIPTHSKKGCLQLPDKDKMVDFLTRALMRRLTPDIKRYTALVVEKGFEHASPAALVEKLSELAETFSNASPGDRMPEALRSPRGRLKMGTSEQVQALIDRYNDGATYKELTEEFNISRGVIWRTLHANGVTGKRQKKSATKRDGAPVGGLVTGKEGTRQPADNEDTVNDALQVAEEDCGATPW